VIESGIEDLTQVLGEQQDQFRTAVISVL